MIYQIIEELKKMELPEGPVTFMPLEVHVHVHFSRSSVHSSSVGIRQLPPQLALAASSERSSTVLLSTVP